MADEPHPTNGRNGYVAWPAYTEDQHRIRSHQDILMVKLEGRVNMVESVIDQQRGARALVYFLIGSNLAVVAGLVLAVIALLN